MFNNSLIYGILSGIPSFPINGLTGYWRFDEEGGNTLSYDAINGKIFTASNSALLGEFNGMNNNCINGINNAYYSTLNSNDSDLLYEITGLTISFWVYAVNSDTFGIWSVGKDGISQTTIGDDECNVDGSDDIVATNVGTIDKTSKFSGGII